MNFIKGLLLLISMLFIGGYSMLCALAMWGSSKLNRIFLRSFGWATRRIVGLEQIVLHEERLNAHRPCVIVANHQTGLDLAILGSICPQSTVIVAKKELQYIPLFGWFFKAAQNILINRSKTEDAKRLINTVTQTLIQKNLNLVVFPEGTRNRHGSGHLLLPFKKGAFHLAVSTKLPLVPVVCSSLQGKAIWENLDLAGGTVFMSVLEPIDTRNVGPKEVDAFRDQVRNLMLAEIQRINLLADEHQRAKKEKKGTPQCHS